MKNITLSADEGLIEAARRRAAAERTTLNAEFRLWHTADAVYVIHSGCKGDGDRCASCAASYQLEGGDSPGKR